MILIMVWFPIAQLLYLVEFGVGDCAIASRQMQQQ
jgi:hypothetical protein